MKGVNQKGDALLDLKNIYFSYPHNDYTLKDISFSLSQGESLGIIGPNGGGKSTLLKIITGQLTPSLGELTWANHGQLSYVPQQNKINEMVPMPVGDLVALGLVNTPSGKEVLSVKQALKWVGLENEEKSVYSKLSGGQKQRALLAKAIVHLPPLIILDEPQTGLDSDGQDKLFQILEDLQKKYSISFIIVDHNLEQIIKRCDKILCLNKTLHWHNKRENFHPSILKSIYHCEFEHLILHLGHQVDLNANTHQEHHFCPEEKNEKGKHHEH